MLFYWSPGFAEPGISSICPANPWQIYWELVSTSPESMAGWSSRHFIIVPGFHHRNRIKTRRLASREDVFQCLGNYRKYCPYSNGMAKPQAALGPVILGAGWTSIGTGLVVRHKNRGSFPLISTILWVEDWAAHQISGSLNFTNIFEPSSAKVHFGAKADASTVTQVMCPPGIHFLSGKPSQTQEGIESDWWKKRGFWFNGPLSFSSIEHVESRGLRTGALAGNWHGNESPFTAKDIDWLDH